MIEEVVQELKDRLADEGPDTEIDIDLAWRAIHAVVRKLDLKKSELLTPMRHALTARVVRFDLIRPILSPTSERPRVSGSLLSSGSGRRSDAERSVSCLAPLALSILC